jgi:hypothetical protein
MRFIKQFTVVLIVIGLILFLSELVCVFILEKIYNRNFDTALAEKNVYETSHALKPFIQTQVWGQKFTTDSYRSRPVKVKSKKVKRVFIGDSVLEGIGLPDSLIFTELLKSESADILNLSMPGNTSKDYLSMVRCITDSSHPEFIHEIKSIHIVHCLNDIYGKTSSSDLPVSIKPFYSKISALLLKVKIFKLIKLFVYQDSKYYYEYDAAFYTDEAKVKETMAFYRCIDSICRQKGIELSFFILPYKSQLASNNIGPQSLMGIKFNEANISAHDLILELKKYNEKDNLYLFADEIHLSASGHKAVAEIIANSHIF